MPLVDIAALVAAGGHIYLGAPDLAKPASMTDPLAPGQGWEHIGHTARDELPEIARDGDDPEIMGSWQNAKLRSSTPDVTYSITLKSIQATADIYRLYFGAGPEAVQTDGSVRIPATPVPQIRSLLVVLVDGARFLPLWHPRVSILGSDAVSMATDAFFTFPLRATFLGSETIGGDIGEWGAIASPTPPGPPSGA